MSEANTRYDAVVCGAGAGGLASAHALGALGLRVLVVDKQPELRPVAKGEVHYHHSLTWHGSHSNSSGRPRRAIALHVMGDDTRYVASGKHIMQSHIDVGDGEKLQGETFPVVYSRAG